MCSCDLHYFAMCDKFALLRPAGLWASVRALLAPVFRLAVATPNDSEENEEANKIEAVG